VADGIVAAVAFIVPGAPVPKGRPIATSQQGRVRMYTPKKTVSYENLVKLCAQSAMDGRLPITGPVSLHVIAHIKPPKSKSKKMQIAMQSDAIRPTGRPDIDNYVKAVADGCNSVVYVDDAQIVSLTAEKKYSDSPCLEVRIEEWAQSEVF
jgi:Holliday junction resolvase RusA-like endonuclease